MINDLERDRGGGRAGGQQCVARLLACSFRIGDCCGLAGLLARRSNRQPKQSLLVCLSCKLPVPSACSCSALRPAYKCRSVHFAGHCFPPLSFSSSSRFLLAAAIALARPALYIVSYMYDKFTPSVVVVVDVARHGLDTH